MHAAFTHLAAHTVDDDEYQNKGKGTADDQGRKGAAGLCNVNSGFFVKTFQEFYNKILYLDYGKDGGNDV